MEWVVVIGYDSQRAMFEAKTETQELGGVAKLIDGEIEAVRMRAGLIASKNGNAITVMTKDGDQIGGSMLPGGDNVEEVHEWITNKQKVVA